ncbi:MAG TPA: hypothetical protein VK589_24320 [Chryseolinea sp.]|nr:hypothetical protein [Chryseolinea sp.]
MTVDIPIKPHLKKFVIFTMEAFEPVVLKEKDLLGSAIMKALQETRQHKFDRRLDQFTSRIKVVLTHDMRERSPRLHRLIYMNTELEREFQVGLLLWVRAQRKMGSPANEACKNFLATLKIDENEYSYDAAYKLWQRFNEIKNKNNAPEVS